MNAANFHDYLKNPSMLHQISYQELKSLMLQYPYSANLRYLMLIKSVLDDNREHDRNLALASLNSVDRRKLRQILVAYQPGEELHESFSLEEDFLELKELDTLEEAPTEQDVPPQKIVMEPPPTLEEAMMALGEVKRDGPMFDSDDDDDFLDSLLNDEPETTGESAVDEEHYSEQSNQEPATPEPSLEDVLMDMDDASMPSAAEAQDELEEELDEIIEEEFSIEELLGVDTDELKDELTEDEGTVKSSADEKKVESLNNMDNIRPETADDKPEDVADMEDLDATPAPASWLNKVKKPKKGFIIEDLSELPPVKKKTKKKKTEKSETKDNAKEVASKSILEDSDIATETLAGVLERQGHYDKAIEMYERLQLKFPEKSSFFAAKIEALKKRK